MQPATEQSAETFNRDCGSSPDEFEQRKKEEIKRLRAKTIEARAHNFQRNCFGARYVGASLAELDFEKEIVEAIKEYCENPKNFLIFLGNAGLGKTHLLAALATWAFENFNTVRYHKEENLMIKLKSCMSDNQEPGRELPFLIDDELVIIDDVGGAIDKTKTQKHFDWRAKTLLDIVDYRYNTMLPTIFTSNFNRKQLNDIYSERTVSRLLAAENTIIMDFDGVDKRTLGM